MMIWSNGVASIKRLNIVIDLFDFKEYELEIKWKKFWGFERFTQVRFEFLSIKLFSFEAFAFYHLIGKKCSND